MYLSALRVWRQLTATSFWDPVDANAASLLLVSPYRSKKKVMAPPKVKGKVSGGSFICFLESISLAVLSLSSIGVDASALGVLLGCVNLDTIHRITELGGTY